MVLVRRVNFMQIKIIGLSGRVIDFLTTLCFIKEGDFFEMNPFLLGIAKYANGSFKNDLLNYDYHL
jgi:hypothetical protein